MPNLFAQQSQSPFVFLSRFVAIDFLVYLRLLICSSISLVLINLLVQTWGNWRLKLRLLTLDISLTGLFFLNSIHNDFHDESDQTWGIAVLLAAMMHKSFFKKFGTKNFEGSHLVYLSFLFGTSFLLVGHPIWFPIFFLGSNFLLLLSLKRLIQTKSQLIWLVLIVNAVFLMAIQFIEAMRIGRVKNKYLVPGSIWDFLSPDPRVYRLQEFMAPVAAAIQPLLRFINKAGTRTEFFNLALIALIAIFVFKTKARDCLIRTFGLRILVTLLTAFFAVLFSGPIVRSEIPFLSSAFRIHSWRVSNIILLIATISSAILFGEASFREMLSQKRGRYSLLRFNQSLALVGISVAILYPMVMLTKDVGNSKFSIFRESKVGLAHKPVLLRGQRFVDLSTNDSDSVWNSLFGTRFSMQLSRAGYPTIEFFGAARQSETLTAKSEPYRSGYVPNTADCRPEVLEFLAVSSIFVNTEDTSGCREKLLAYFGEDSVREINKVAGPPGTASLFRPKSFATWSIVTDSAENPSVSCPLLEQVCLKGLEVTKLPSTGQAPFRLCEDNCLFAYNWAKTGNAKQVLLPVNFDKTIEIKDSLTGKRLETANYQGLLAVQVDGNETSGVFTGNIRPDLMMWLRVAMTYLHTVVFLGALVAMLVKGVRAVKEISRTSESQSAN